MRFEPGAGLTSHASLLLLLHLLACSLRAGLSELFVCLRCVHGRRVQQIEGRSDGDQRREDWHRCGGRGEDIRLCREHWLLNRHQLAAVPPVCKSTSQSVERGRRVDAGTP